MNLGLRLRGEVLWLGLKEKVGSRNTEIGKQSLSSRMNNMAKTHRHMVCGVEIYGGDVK